MLSEQIEKNHSLQTENMVLLSQTTISSTEYESIGNVLKEKLGADFANKLGEDSSLIEIMYE